MKNVLISVYEFFPFRLNSSIHSTFRQIPSTHSSLLLNTTLIGLIKKNNYNSKSKFTNVVTVITRVTSGFKKDQKIKKKLLSNIQNSYFNVYTFHSIFITAEKTISKALT